jgi:hypothetical protein
MQILAGAASGLGHARFPALLLERHLISRRELTTAQQHAQREHIELPEALVALGLATEASCYALLAEAAGPTLVDLAGGTSSELAVRLVPERLAWRHFVVPLAVDDRTLTYATSRPVDAEVRAGSMFGSRRITRSSSWRPARRRSKKSIGC